MTLNKLSMLETPSGRAQIHFRYILTDRDIFSYHIAKIICYIAEAQTADMLTQN